MSVGKQLTNKRVNNCIAVIGDGAITGGMAFEALNNAGYLRSRMIVILNDNGQVSLPTGTHSAGGVVPAGALSSYTSRLLSSKPFQDFRSFAKGLNRLMPSEIQVLTNDEPTSRIGAGRAPGVVCMHARCFGSRPQPHPKSILTQQDINAKIDEYARGLIQGGTLFEELGFYYIGPVDGHDLDNLIPILENLRDSPSTKPVLLHVKVRRGGVGQSWARTRRPPLFLEGRPDPPPTHHLTHPHTQTEKGYGYPPAEAASDKYHGVAKFDVSTGRQFKGGAKGACVCRVCGLLGSNWRA